VLGLITLGSSPGIRGFIEPDLNPKLMLISIAIAVVVGVLSGLYPAWRSSRLTPSLALQN
jgi:putative ABC transport system permease protein